MNLIKIGNTIINMDNVTHIEGDSGVHIYFNVDDEDGEQFHFSDYRNQALAAYEWLTSACLFDANDTEPPAEDDKPLSYRLVTETETEALRERIAELEARLDERNQLIADAGRELGQTSGDEHFTRAFNMLHGYTD